MRPQPSKNPSSPKPKSFTITIFGAESTGKTTLSRELATVLGAQWLYEFARPYLELTSAPITPSSMTAIWHGQQVLQTMREGHVIVQDTDLFSTVGYWQFPHWHPVLGDCPAALIRDAKHLQSDLYLITPSNIPFEHDPLRYGGDAREGTDDYWVAVCEKYQLPYVVLNSSDPSARVTEALTIMQTKENLCAASSLANFTHPT